MRFWGSSVSFWVPELPLTFWGWIVEFSTMLSVHSLPRVEHDPQYGWQVVFWLGEAFDYGIPFRAALDEMVEALQMEAPALVELPPQSSDEDFVEGSLVFGQVRLKIYFEYSLGYLAFMSQDKGVLKIVTERLLPLVRVRRL